MAAANSIARWYFSEGTGATVADATGNGNTLTLSGTGSQWTSIASGSGWEITNAPATANSPLALISDVTVTGNISAALNGADEFSMLFVLNDIATPSGSTSFIARIGSDQASGGSFFIEMDSSRRLVFRMGTEFASVQTCFFSLGSPVPTGLVVISLQVDTKLANGNDRVKCKINNTLAGVEYSEIGQNFTLGMFSGQGFSLMNRQTLNRNVDGTMLYAELFTGYLTDQQVTDAVANLTADNDSDWAVTGMTFVSQPAIDQVTSTSGRLQLTTSLPATSVKILQTAAGSSQPAPSAFDAVSSIGTTSAYTVFQYNIINLTPDSSYRYWVQVTDGVTTLYGSADVTTPAISNTILSVNGGQAIREGQQNVVILREAGATGTTTTTWNGVAQNGHTVVSDTESNFDFVWPNILYGQTALISVDGVTIQSPPLQPAVGSAYVTLSASYNPSTPGAITAFPDAVAGDQIGYITQSGAVSVDDLGRPTFTSSFDGSLVCWIVDSADGTRSANATIPYTAPADVIPDQFDLGANATGVNPSTAVVRSFVVLGVDAGANVTFTATGSAQVSNDNVTWASSTTQQLNGTVYVRLTSGTYDAVVSGGVSSGGISDSFSVTTRSRSVPTITVQPTNQNVTAGQSATFTVSATNATNYQWYEEVGGNGIPIAGATSSSYTRSTVLSDNNKQFYCVVTSSEGGTTASSSATLIVLAANLTLTSQPLRDSITREVRANVSDIPVRIRKSDGSISYSGLVTTDALGVFTITNNTMAVVGETVSIEFPDSASGTYSGFNYTFSGG